MNYLKIIFIVFAGMSFALADNSFEIRKININCEKSEGCKDVRKAFGSLVRSYKDEDNFQKILKLYVANEGIRKFEFSVTKDKILNIRLQTKQIITSIVGPVVKGQFDIEFPSILPIREDEFLDSSKIDSTIRLLTDIARDQGFPKVRVAIKTKRKGEGSEVKVEVYLGKPTVIQEIFINSKSKRIKKLIEEKIGHYEGKPYSSQKIRTDLEDLRKVLLQYGYYLIDFDIDDKLNELQATEVVIDVLNTETYSFHIFDNTFLGEKELKDFLSGQLISLKRKISKETIQQMLKENYLQYGFRKAEFAVNTERSLNTFGDENIHFVIKALENKRAAFEKVRFRGNSIFNSQELRNLFYEQAPDTISAGYINPEYLDSFTERLRELYITQGYVSVFIGKPEVVKAMEEDKFTIFYRIREGIQTKVDRVVMDGLGDGIRNTLLPNLLNRPGAAFNPIAFKDDLKYIENYLHNEGYYFAKVTNTNSSQIVEYKQDNSRVDLTINIDTGRKLTIGEVLVIGNKKTRKYLIEREIYFRTGDVLTRRSLEASQTSLLSLGLFSSVQIKPISSDQKIADIVIFVREKDFGTFELAPGIRTDIGLKLSSTINYNNIDGMNKKISSRFQVNQRFDLFALDEERRANSRSLVEYDATVNYSENHIFYSDYDFGLALNSSRRRFFSFDADIQRVSYSISRNFTSWFNASIRQQLETISQFDATQERDDGFFQIGSFTPSITFDFRDRPINPTRGAIFDLSVEFANPFFLSQQEEDLTIDYYKLTTRNRFYVPVSDNLVLAMYTAFGIQENKATNLNSSGEKEGFIPGIKVFRLIGADIIRGYEDNEMNRLESGEDISAVAVDTRAYMVNLKFEPRYYLTDSMILGIFYDAGRVFVDEFDMNELRSSAGLSFKYLTPVGTLDFDYGIKLLRKRDSDGTLDSPGRLHVSIGFF